MTKLSAVMAYLCERTTARSGMSLGRLTKLIYLADWKSAIDHKRQITEISWLLGQFGPYVNDIAEEALRNPDFEVTPRGESAGYPTDMIRYTGSGSKRFLSAEERYILDHVIGVALELPLADLLKLINSTYPVLTQTQYNPLDLINLAEKYRGVRHLLAAAAT